ncbi:MAG: TRAP transporter small permease subunit [Pseudomonadales bacterium]|nr:TRAP transporter small permease subunit [Pseudomonadales bacterium]
MRTTHFIDRITRSIGHTVSWCMAIMVASTLLVVLLRYLAGDGSIVLQEAVLYLHATSFMLGIGYALQQDAHVRVDVFYTRRSPAGKAWVNLSGHLFLLVPVAVTILWTSLPYVAASWRVLEGSPEVGGIPGIFLLKSLLPLTAGLLLLQGVAESVRSISLLRRGVPVDGR